MRHRDREPCARGEIRTVSKLIDLHRQCVSLTSASNRARRPVQKFPEPASPRNVHTSFQMKLLKMATSAAITLLRLRFQPSMKGEANIQIMPMSKTKPVPPTMQNLA